MIDQPYGRLARHNNPVQVELPALSGKARVDTANGAITVLVSLDKADVETLASCAKTPEANTR